MSDRSVDACASGISKDKADVCQTNIEINLMTDILLVRVSSTSLAYVYNMGYRGLQVLKNILGIFHKSYYKRRVYCFLIKWHTLHQ